VAYFLMDREHLEQLTSDLFFQPWVKSVQDAPTVSAAVQAQNMRHTALYRMLTGGRPEAAATLVNDTIKIDGNERSARIALCNIHRIQPNYITSAWEDIAPSYLASRGSFIEHGRNPENLPPGLVHQFICLMRGAICRSIAGAKYPESDLEEDVATTTSCSRMFSRRARLWRSGNPSSRSKPRGRPMPSRRIASSMAIVFQTRSWRSA
jgi:hypothetical protein